jgi:hypothetical protein
MITRAAATRFGIVAVQRVFGVCFYQVPEIQPSAVFIARPNPPIYAEDGRRLDVPQDTANEGHAELLAWLYSIGCDRPSYARVQLPSGIHDFPPHWVHPAGNIPVIRIERAHPWRDAAA